MAIHFLVSALWEVDMEDLWKLKEMRYRVNDLADRAEYNRFVERFHKEEESGHKKNLLYKQVQLNKTQKDSDDK